MNRKQEIIGWCMIASFCAAFIYQMVRFQDILTSHGIDNATYGLLYSTVLRVTGMFLVPIIISGGILIYVLRDKGK